MERNEDRKIRKEHFKNLVAVAMADNFLDEAEKEILAERAEELGMPEDEVQAIIDNAHELKFQVPLNKVDKEEQLTDTVFMAMIDGEVHEKEYQLCLSMAERLDLQKRYVDHIIELTKQLWEKAQA